MSESIQAKTIASYLDDIEREQQALAGEDNQYIRVRRLEGLLVGPLALAKAELEEAPEEETTALAAALAYTEATLWGDIHDAYATASAVRAEDAQKAKAAARACVLAAARALTLDPSRVALLPMIAACLEVLGREDAQLDALAACLGSGNEAVVIVARKRLAEMGVRPKDVQGRTFAPATIAEGLSGEHQTYLRHGRAVAAAKREARAVSKDRRNRAVVLGGSGCGVLVVATLLQAAGEAVGGNGVVLDIIVQLAGFLGYGVLAAALVLWIGSKAAGLSGE